jgi:hypothetical protein
MYQSQQISTDLCTDLYIHSTQDSFCGGNSLRSKMWILYEGGVRYSRTFRSPQIYQSIRRSGWLRILIFYRFVLILLCIACLVDAVFGTASFP